MPDLITHITATHLATRIPGLFKSKIYEYYQEYRLLIFLGALFPDIISKPLQYISTTLYNFSFPIHSPLVVLFAAFVVTRFVYINNKKCSFFTIAGFSMFHIFLDNLQQGLNPGYQTFFPFSLKRYGLNVISSEMYLYLMGVMVVLSGILELYYYIRKRKKTPAPVSNNNEI
jgi:hypothetical protein